MLFFCIYAKEMYKAFLVRAGLAFCSSALCNDVFVTVAVFLIFLEQGPEHGNS